MNIKLTKLAFINMQLANSLKSCTTSSQTLLSLHMTKSF